MKFSLSVIIGTAIGAAIGSATHHIAEGVDFGVSAGVLLAYISKRRQAAACKVNHKTK